MYSWNIGHKDYHGKDGWLSTDKLRQEQKKTLEQWYVCKEMDKETTTHVLHTTMWHEITLPQERKIFWK